ncbi:MAG: hypothetical protein ABI467_15565 [Kofleriaceae bacterium]
MRQHWIMVVGFAVVAGCAVAGDEESTDGVQTSEVSSKIIYDYVSPTAPGSQGFGTLALRRANAKPGTFNPTYGAATLPKIKLASDALVTQAELDAVLAIPYAGHENSVVALFGGRTTGSIFSDPTFEVVEIYTPNQPVSITSVAQKDALYQLAPSGSQVTVRLINEKDYAASSAPLSADYSATPNPTAARVAVQGGAYFTGSVTISCHKVLWWTNCDPPSGVHVTAYFEAN